MKQSINNNEDVVSDREKNRITKILKEYSIVPENIEKIRSVYKIKYNNKCYCLKKIKNSKKALKIFYLTQYLKDRGFNNIATFVCTNNGKKYIKTKHNIYYLTEWIDGRECNIYDIEELKKAAMLLAEFHIKVKGFTNKDCKIYGRENNWYIEFKKKRNDILKFKSIIENKKIKSIFDIEYYNSIDTIIKSLDISSDLLDRSKYYELIKKAKLEKEICHDSFYYQNIIVDKDNMYIVDLDSTVYDISIYDISKFIRRILDKKIYSWDFNIARELLEAYSTIKPLTKDEYEVILSFIIFPHKFWKIGKKRYYKSKKWDEDKYLRKLKRILKYNENKEKFIKDYIDYYNI